MPARFVVQLLKVQKRQLGLWLGLLVVLMFSEAMPCLRAQDAAKTHPQPNAPQPTSQGQAKTVTCTVEISGKALSTSLAEALRLYRTGKLDDSAGAYNAIITSGGPDTVLAYAGLARVYLKQEKINDAFAAASKAVALTPGKTPAITVLGEVYFRQGKLTLAEESFLNSLKACDVDARSYLGFRSTMAIPTPSPLTDPIVQISTQRVPQMRLPAKSV